ncbi:protein of unknown function DUF4005 [Cynara cardunculus var. scolymus]|uniref:DUF4005 domain-containing protein n=1 Tax=Cynara cardunculus var. scolymus TaxID=59895 RepID=A0A103XJ54_CYNCS|nr:protein of unknown function DUF4005 [Cynara cardunculus var. scolymus]
MADGESREAATCEAATAECRLRAPRGREPTTADYKRRWLFRRSSNIPTPSLDLDQEEKTSIQHSTSIKQHFAATLIQTSFRAYLARRASRALKGIVMLQSLIRGQIVRNQTAITFKCIQTLLRVQSRLNIKPSRLQPPLLNHLISQSSTHESCNPYEDYTLEQLDPVLQTRKEAVLSRDIKELQERANWLARWMEAKQSGTPTSRRSSYSPSVGPQSVTPSPIKIEPLLVQSASPRCRKENRNYLRATPSYMAATESAKAKIRPQNSPRPEREQMGSAKKRLSYSVQDMSHDYIARYRGYGHNSRSPSFKSVQVNRRHEEMAH